MKKLLALAFLASLLIVGPAHAAGPSITLVSPTQPYHGDVVTLAATGGNTPWAFVRCFDTDGDYVFAHYYANENGTVVTDPLHNDYQDLWLSGGGNCIVELGFFAAQGFGDWKIRATTTFEVLA